MPVSNSAEGGLSTEVCTTGLNRAIAYIKGLNVSICNIWEQPSYRIEKSPFGGKKDNGTGVKERGNDAIKLFINIKTYSLPWD